MSIVSILDRYAVGLLTNVGNFLITWLVSLIGVDVITYVFLIPSLIYALLFIGRVYLDYRSPALWLRHCAPVDDLHSIIRNGFEPPKQEIQYAKDTGVDQEALYQNGRDVVSFSAGHDIAFRSMVSTRWPGKELGYIYLKLSPASYASVIASSCMYGIAIKHGVSTEFVVSREKVNAAIFKGEFLSVEPENFYSWVTLAYRLTSVIPNLSLRQVIATIKCRRQLSL